MDTFWPPSTQVEMSEENLGEESSSSPVSPVDSLSNSEGELDSQPKRCGRKRRPSRKNGEDSDSPTPGKRGKKSSSSSPQSFEDRSIFFSVVPHVDSSTVMGKPEQVPLSAAAALHRV